MKGKMYKFGGGKAGEGKLLGKGKVWERKEGKFRGGKLPRGKLWDGREA